LTWGLVQREGGGRWRGKLVFFTINKVLRVTRDLFLLATRSAKTTSSTVLFGGSEVGVTSKKRKRKDVEWYETRKTREK